MYIPTDKYISYSTFGVRSPRYSRVKCMLNIPLERSREHTHPREHLLVSSMRVSTQQLRPRPALARAKSNARKTHTHTILYMYSVHKYHALKCKSHSSANVCRKFFCVCRKLRWCVSDSFDSPFELLERQRRRRRSAVIYLIQYVRVTVLG